MVDWKSVDMTKAEDMALNISWCVAEQAAGYLEIIMAGMTQEGINSLMHIIDEASGEVLVEIIKAVFIVNQMQEAENILIPLEICAKYCDDSRNEIGVIGQNRFGKYVVEGVSLKLIENVRFQRVYKPVVLEIMKYLEFMDGWEWWKRTAEDRREAIAFAEMMVKRINNSKLMR